MTEDRGTRNTNHREERTQTLDDPRDENVWRDTVDVDRQPRAARARTATVPPRKRGQPSARRAGAARMLGGLIVAGILAALLLGAAYQVRPTYRVTLGDAPHDAALVADFYPPERQPAQDGGRTFRWTQDDSVITLPGIGRDAVSATLILAGSRNPHPDVRVLANGVAVGAFHVTPDFQPYRVDVPASLMRGGSLTLDIVAPTFTLPGDRRELGVVARAMIVQPVGAGFALPPARVAFSLWLGAVCVALAFLVAGFGIATACAGAAIVAAGMAAFLIRDRPFLTVDAGGIARGGLLMLAVAAVIVLLLPSLCSRSGLPTARRDVRWLAIIAGSVLALRFASMLHPGMVIVDLPFHLHRLADVADRHMLLLRTTAEEFQDKAMYYVPTPYLILWPFTRVVQDQDRATLFFLLAMAIEAVRYCVLWIVARAATRDLLSANLAALAMALMPVDWIIFSWGSFPNLLGEGALTVLFALLALRYRDLTAASRWRSVVAFTAVILLALLTHNGVFVLTAASLALYLLARAGHNTWRRKRPWAGGVPLLTVAGLAAAALAFILFYRIPFHALLTGQRTPTATAATDTAATITGYRTGGATPDASIGLPQIETTHLVVALAREAWEMSYAFYRIWPILAALAGLALLIRRARPHAGSERDAPGTPVAAGRMGDTALVIAVWLAVAAIMLVVGITTRFYVRYPLYALPAVALGAGVAAAWLIRRVCWGWCVVALLLGYSAITTLLLWYDRIVYAYKAIV